MGRITFSQTFHIKSLRSKLSADLRKSCWIAGKSLSSTEKNILFFEKIEPSSALKNLVCLNIAYTKDIEKLCTLFNKNDITPVGKKDTKENTRRIPAVDKKRQGHKQFY